MPALGSHGAPPLQEQVRLTLVRDHPHGANQLAKSPDGHATVRLSPRGTHTAVVLVDKLDRATLRAIRYARTLGANDVFAIHAALDPANAAVLADVWMSQHLPIPLVLVECWDRNVGRALEQDILRMSKRRDRGHRGHATPGLPDAPAAAVARPDEP